MEKSILVEKPDIAVDIKGLSRAQLQDSLKEMGQPSFRAKQLEQWLYGKSVRSFQEMTNLSASLREDLAAAYQLGFPTIAARQDSSDTTRKYLLRFHDETTVETVGIPSRDAKRLTVCFSTQAGCAMGCTFCATGQSGWTRNLSCGEMVDQVALMGEEFSTRVDNVVAMGQGEPFANYDALLSALRFINSKDGLGIGARHITVSSCGITDGILRFADEPEQFTLAISLHSAIQKTRDSLMPGLKNYPISSLKNSLREYTEKSGRRVSIEYSPMAGINDSHEDLKALMTFCHGLACHVNLIPLNPIEGSAFKPSGHLIEFRDTLSGKGFETSIRNSRGGDIDGACGQLRQKLSI